LWQSEASINISEVMANNLMRVFNQTRAKEVRS
jgi:hypothetical protein